MVALSKPGANGQRLLGMLPPARGSAPCKAFEPHKHGYSTSMLFRCYSYYYYYYYYYYYSYSYSYSYSKSTLRHFRKAILGPTQNTRGCFGVIEIG